MEITQVIRGRRRSAGPPSTRAQILLVLSAFLCGTVLAALLFVGIWRHTADDGARARAVQAADHRRLVAAQHRLAALTARLERSQALLATSRRREASAVRALAAERARAGALGRTLPPRLNAIAATTGTLAAKLSTLQSELEAIQSYLRSPGSSGVDAAYLATQARYLAGSTDAAISAAQGLARDAQAAESAFAHARK